MTGTMYYIVMPAMFDWRASFAAKVSDVRALEFGELLYDVIGVFPLIFLGAIFLNAYQKSTRDHSINAFG